MKTYGVAVIGCGYMGKAHLEALSRHERTQVTAVVDANAAVARETARQFGIPRWHTDYRVFAGDRDVDAVVIATYPSTHLEITKEYLAHGKHVLCEKPVAANPADTQAFFRLCRRAKAKVMVGHILRHNETYRQAMQMIHSGKIGFPLVMRMSQVKQSQHWAGHLALLQDASPIVDCGVHYFDLMRWATGSELESVSGIGQRLDGDVPAHTYNYGLAAVAMADGSAGYFEAGWGQTLKTDFRKEFTGPKGRIEIIYQCFRPLSQQSLGNAIRFYDFASGEMTETNIPYEGKSTLSQISHFVRVMDGKAEPVPSLEDVCSAMHMALMADQAIREKRVLTNPDARCGQDIPLPHCIS
ncbi:Gfo/Idh/MocA family protein [Paenibacillus sp. YN15]|uniref:Gfo/Idh/MocA family protein n=1 Tax=Paenibacillus sp. YN15 TaxID=1742774 RepID=UPI0015ECAE85|nr:Gfo/Idh/MocA family oxidoreductase [Paenibacillus sp. YN15]